ncbi:LuxR C-terminal-related transcriptional regulator [Actinotalea sp. Marseille-Q4924]|uniref:LuxR C-terminal-related transcriptional regulator n=1 Tax=Actinotalea sp. Marseille-Q4924 TaxID=2866571 RepID=UPI001CE4544F|nr:LuxR C-terminal-related transcriptional regulator [Actinotalea sp. Marseille-Q4924]
MSSDAVLRQARDAYRAHAWQQVHRLFETADGESGLEAADLDAFARAAYLLGEEDRSVRLLERAYHDHLGHGRAEDAAHSAFWIAFQLLNRGETARAGGWLARAHQLADEQFTDRPIAGLLLVPRALHSLFHGDAAESLSVFTRAWSIGRRCRDAGLSALGGLGRGQSMLLLGDHTGAFASLDEVMVAVTADEVDPIVSGVVYCAVLGACHKTYEMERANEWTRSFSRWCESQPGLVAFRGRCLVHRAQLLLLAGAWPDAMEQVRLARLRFAGPDGQDAIGMALYEQAELHRLRGELAAAQDVYLQASEVGHEPQPGLALLRLAQGNHAAARAGILRALDDPLLRDDPRTLMACVEIALAAEDLEEARRACAALAAVARDHATTMLSAMDAHAHGAVLLAEGDARSATGQLRRALAGYRELGAPYLGARVQQLHALACRALGDDDAAQLELDAAARVFRRLGAELDLATATGLGAEVEGMSTGPLTARELEVIREVATGKTNRAIARDLLLSEKTVARHVSNIFTKLDLSSRAAATAYAYEHHLV